MAKMTKWDTIQADVSDMYIGKQELEDWEKAYKDEFYSIFEEDENDLEMEIKEKRADEDKDEKRWIVKRKLSQVLKPTN